MTTRRRHSPLGSALILLAFVLSLGSAAVVAPLLALPLTLLSALLVPRLLLRGRKLAARDGAESLALERRPPVVLLRSFADDETVYKPNFLRTGYRQHATFSSWMWGFTLDTYEERMAHALRPLGPVVAIGDPTDRLSPLGADRLYVGDEPWQEEVLQLIRRAGVVVLQVADTPSLVWECEQVLREVEPSRLLLAIPVDSREGMRPLTRRYDAFRAATADLFPHPLPESIGNAQFISFDDEWRPQTFDPATDHAPGGTARDRLRRQFRPYRGRRRFVFGSVGVVTVVVIGLVIWGSTYDGYDYDPPSSSESAALDSPAVRQVSIDAHASADMRSEPTRERSTQNVIGYDVPLVTLLDDEGDEAFMLVSYAFPAAIVEPQDPRTMLHNSLVFASRGMKMEPGEEKAVGTDALPGLQMIARSSDGALEALLVVYLHGNTVYGAWALSRNGAGTPEGRAQFVRSLRITD
jgi:hypothetical protein